MAPEESVSAYVHCGEQRGVDLRLVDMIEGVDESQSNEG